MNTAVLPAGTGMLTYLDKAAGLLRKIGLPFETKEEAPVVALIQQIAHVDEGKAVALARVLSQASLFNQVVRDEISGMAYSNRFEGITAAFDSIRDDGRQLVDQIADGKISLSERLQNTWMNMSRGSIPARFDKIRDTYLEVAKDLKIQMERERNILTAYADYRVAQKEGQIVALQLLGAADALVQAAKEALEASMAAVSADDGTDPQRRARLELNRDQALRALQDQDKVFQITKDLADNLTVGYGASEVVMARLQQSTQIKERVYSQMVVFFSTNEVTFTALNASLTSMLGLNEGTKSLNAMKDGMNQSLEVLAELGNTTLEEGIKAGYGPNLKVESVKKLVDAVVNFQETSIALITEARKEATDTSTQIASVVEDGQRRFAALVLKSGAA